MVDLPTIENRVRKNYKTISFTSVVGLSPTTYYGRPVCGTVHSAVLLGSNGKPLRLHHLGFCCEVPKNPIQLIKRKLELKAHLN